MNRWNRLFIHGRAEPGDLLVLLYDAGVGETAAAEGAKTAGEAAAAEGAAGAATEGTAGAAAGAAGASGGGLSSADLAALYGDVGYTGATTGGALPGWVGTLGKEVGTAAVTAGVTQAMTPKRPDLPKPIAMPDPQATEEARKRSLIEQLARRGRASTVLTQASGDKLGG